MNTTPPDQSTVAETKALRLLRDGYSPGQIFDQTGMTKDRLEVLARTFGGSRPAPPSPGMPPARPVGGQPDSIGEWIAQAKQSPLAVVRKAAEKVERAVNELRVTQQAQAERERQLQREAEQKAARRREIADAERALEAARERLRKLKGGKSSPAQKPADRPSAEKVPVDERRRRLPEMLAEGISKVECARQLGVSEAQIYLDLKAIEAANG